MTTMTTTRTTTGAPATLGGTWTIDPSHTTVEFAVRHLMIATVKGRFGTVAGSVTLDPTRPFAPDVSVDIDVASVDTREAKRDAHLRSADFFDAGKFPAMTFRGKRVQGDINGRFKLVGDLTIRDVTKEVTLDVTNEGRVRDPWGSDRVGFSATAKLNRADYGLTWNMALEAGGFMVGDAVTLNIEAEFTRQADAA